MTNEVLDLQFAHVKAVILLGCIEENALHIHRIDNSSAVMTCTLLLKIEETPCVPMAPTNKISWCPYVPETDQEIDEYSSQELVWIRGATYQCYSIRSVIDNYGTGTSLKANAIEGTLRHKESSIITGATLSPDGTTLSVSCEDGVIRFYQVYFHTNESTPRCLHQWIPHGGKTVNSFFFLDNHTQNSTDKSLWRHAITTSDNNTEIKVWSCSTWECTQTIHFQSSLSSSSPLNLLVEIDRTSSYLILSDMKNRGLYVLQIQKNAGTAKATAIGKRLNSVKNDDVDAAAAAAANGNGDVVANETKSLAYIKSISEFPMSSSILSFGIVDAAVRKYKCAYNDTFLIDELDDYDEENHLLYCVVIHMFLVQPKSVQECHILYQPSVSDSTDVNVSSSSCDGGGDADEDGDEMESGKSMELTLPTNDESDDAYGGVIGGVDACSPQSAQLLVSSVAIPLPAPPAPKILSPKMENLILVGAAKTTGAINLMTPDSFNSPGKCVDCEKLYSNRFSFGSFSRE